MSSEKIIRPNEVIQWFGDMEIGGYIYTVGEAGERFFKTLKDKGLLVASKCDKCGNKYIPPKTFCENCFSEIKEYVEIEPVGIVETYTILHIDKDNKPISPPIVVAFISFDNIKGGLIHKLKINTNELKIGIKVRAKLKPENERKGNINDIEYFEKI
jgi:uncharacterized OB-fold protein